MCYVGCWRKQTDRIKFCILCDKEELSEILVSMYVVSFYQSKNKCRRNRYVGTKWKMGFYKSEDCYTYEYFGK